MSTIAENIAKVGVRIREAAQASQRDCATVGLLAVSKTKPAAAIRQAFAAGVRDTYSDLCNILCYRGHYLRPPPGFRGILPPLGSPMDITELLAFSAKQGASDLHLSAGL